jgi:hypothetical protein
MRRLVLIAAAFVLAVSLFPCELFASSGIGREQTIRLPWGKYRSWLVTTTGTAQDPVILAPLDPLATFNNSRGPKPGMQWTNKYNGWTFDPDRSVYVAPKSAARYDTNLKIWVRDIHIPSVMTCCIDQNGAILQGKEARESGYWFPSDALEAAETYEIKNLGGDANCGRLYNCGDAAAVDPSKNPPPPNPNPNPLDDPRVQKYLDENFPDPDARAAAEQAILDAWKKGQSNPPRHLGNLTTSLQLPAPGKRFSAPPTPSAPAGTPTVTSLTRSTPLTTGTRVTSAHRASDITGLGPSSGRLSNTGSGIRIDPALLRTGGSPSQKLVGTLFHNTVIPAGAVASSSFNSRGNAGPLLHGPSPSLTNGGIKIDIPQSALASRAPVAPRDISGASIPFPGNGKPVQSKQFKKSAPNNSTITVTPNIRVPITIPNVRVPTAPVRVVTPVIRVPTVTVRAPAPTVRVVTPPAPTIRVPTVRPPSSTITGSDIRLKRDIAEVGRLPNGLRLYRYRYVWSDVVYVGVMAQEVLTVAPDAVALRPDGYLGVDYARLGLKLLTFDQWTARRRTVSQNLH